MGALVFTIVTVLIGVLSVAFCGLSVFRLQSYIQAYRFDRDQYRPLLGMVRLRMVMWTYGLVTLMLAAFLVVFFIYLHQ